MKWKNLPFLGSVTLQIALLKTKFRIARFNNGGVSRIYMGNCIDRGGAL